VLSQLNKHLEALYHGQMASFFCQQLIKNTHILCGSYITRLERETAHINGVESHVLGSPPASIGISMGDKVAIDDEEDPLHMLSS
jgi:hypothetical protein